MNVRYVRVGDVLRLERRLLDIDPAAYYSAIGVRSFAKGLIRYPSCTGAELSKMRYYELPPSCLVVSNIKAWEGAVAQASGEDVGLVVSNRFLTYVPAVPEVSTRYVWHYLCSDPGTAALSKASPGSADRNRTLSIKAFEALVIPIPPAADQEAIAVELDSVVSTAESGIPDGAPVVRAALAERIISQAYGCERVPIGAFLKLMRPWLRLDDKTTYRPIGVRSFGRGLIKYPSAGVEALSLLRYYSLVPNSLVVSNIKAWEGAITLTTNNDVGLIASNRFLCYQPSGEGPSLQFVLRYLLSREGLQALGKASPGSADRNRTLGIDPFEKLDVPFPSAQMQRKIVSSLDVIDALGAQERRKQQLLAALPQAARNEVFSKLV